ncbi:helix-turn-helix domain-containing protein [Streptomyces varsoviensis]|uniref:helix-turn-helix domain-containing protein n=1 Tax=Streptomyces varsoviensis TaxID=67373 RepID=UPI00340899FB
MSRPPALPPNKKAELVLAVLTGELSTAGAARQVGVSEQAIGNWKRQFIRSGTHGLEGGSGQQSSERERRLLAQITELKTALGEVYVQLRAKRREVEYRTVPFPTSTPYEKNAV